MSYTNLYRAISSRDLELFKKELQKQNQELNVKANDISGKTPLINAAFHGNFTFCDCKSIQGDCLYTDYKRSKY